MKLTSIDLYSNNQQVASLSFRDPGSRNPYIAQNTTGLDAGEIVPKFYGNSNSGKKQYNLSLVKREVVLLISLNPQFSLGKSYSDLRDDLYRAVASSRDGLVQLQFKNGSSTIACVSGFVTKFETGMFSKTPQVQMTINCEDGMLRSLNEISVDEVILGTSNTIVDNASTAPHGFKFNITFNAPTTSFVIRDATVPDWLFTITPGVIGANTGFINNDQLYFSSAYNGRLVYIVRGGVTIYLVDKIQPGSIWPILFPGPNDLELVSTGAFTWNELTYYQTYWGV